VKKKPLLAFLLGAAVGAGGMYVWLSHRHETGPFRANRVRSPDAPTEGDRQWAEPVDQPGLKNFHRVSGRLYRGAQPTEDGFRQLKAGGVRTIVNLRSFNSDRDLIGETGLGYEHIYMKAYHPEEEEVVRFLQIVTDEARTPVFVHCKHGSDRTGAMCAVYRIFVQGWSKAEAIKEMTEGGFGFHGTFDGLVEFLEKLDVDDIRKRAGIARPARAATQPQPGAGGSGA